VAETEELRLTVTLDDQASAQLGALREQLNGLSDAAQRQQRAAGTSAGGRRQQREAAQGAKETAQEMGRLATTIGVVSGVVGGVVSRITDLGLTFASRALDVRAYSKEIVNLHDNAYAMGTDAAQLQSSIEHLMEAGVPKETATKELGDFNQRVAELGRAGSALNRDLIYRDQTGFMMDFRNRMLAAKENERLDIVHDAGVRLRKLWIERGESEAAAAAAEQKFYARLGVQEIMRRYPKGPLPEATPQQKQLMEDRKRAAEQFELQMNRSEITVGNIYKTFTAIGLEFLGINKAVGSVNTYSSAVLKDLMNWETSLRKTDGSMDELIAATIKWGETADTFVGRELARLAKDAAKFVDDVKAGYKVLQDMGVLPKPPPPPGSREAIQQEQMRKFQEQQKYDKELQIQLQQEAEAESLPGTQAASRKAATDKRAAEEAEKNRIIELEKWQQEQRRLHPPAPRMGTTPGAPLIEAPPEGVAPEAVPSVETAPLTPAQQKRKEAAEEANRAAAAARSVQSLPNITPALPLPLMPLGIVTTLFQRYFEARQAPAVTPTTPDALQRARELLNQQQSEPPAATAPPQPATAPPQITVAPTPPQPIIVPTSPAPPVPSYGEGDLDLFNFGKRSEAEPPPRIFAQAPPSAFEGGMPIDLAGMGSAGSATGAERGQTPGWQTAALLDRARDVNVNGTGTISVDVRAPAGTTVKAAGGGLFRRTEVNRQVQMEPAEFGPTLPVGA